MIGTLDVGMVGLGQHTLAFTKDEEQTLWLDGSGGLGKGNLPSSLCWPFGFWSCPSSGDFQPGAF